MNDSARIYLNQQVHDHRSVFPQEEGLLGLPQDALLGRRVFRCAKNSLQINLDWR